MTIIYSYTRKQAIADGVLVDVTKTAAEAGFRLGVAMTSTVWEGYVSVPPGLGDQDEDGRLWDILWMLSVAIHGTKTQSSELNYQVLVKNDKTGPKPVTLKAVIGPDDDRRPCLTIMMPDED